jgi:hypothetical protein
MEVRAGPRYVGGGGVPTCLGLVIWRLLKPLFFNVYRPRTGLATLSENACPKCGYFSERFFRVWNPEFTSTVGLIPSFPVTS